MSCLNDAIERLVGFYPDIPDPLPAENLAQEAARLGLRFWTGQDIEIDEQPLVFVIKTSDDEGHALYIPGDRIGLFLRLNRFPIIGVFAKAERGL